MNKSLMGITIFLLVQCFGLVSASAQECGPILGNTVVFGGLGSKTHDMQTCYPEFFAVSHEDAPKFIACLAQQINARKDEKFVIAGHSSGAGDAERLALMIQDKSRMRLVLLEGFSHLLKDRSDIKTTCWYAQNSEKRIFGFNAPSMLDPTVCPQPAKPFEAAWCNTSLCLHVANVNLNTPSNLNKATALTGLANCSGNTDWVKEHLDC